MSRGPDLPNRQAMRHRRDLCLVLGAALLLAIVAAGTLGSATWIGKPFPGFLVLANRVVASAGLQHWPATRGGGIYQHEVVTVDGRPLADAGDLHRHARSLPVGTPIRYGLRRDGVERELEVPTRRFGGLDFALLFGSYLFCGIGLCGVALTIRFLRRSDPAANGTALALGLIGAWALTAMDLYGPYRMFRAHALLECLLFAGTLHLALVFPYPRRLVVRAPRLLLVPYAAALALALVSQLGLHDPPHYVTTHRIAVTAFGLSLLVLIASQLSAFLRPPSFEVRQRVKVVVLGSVAALTPQVALSLGSALSGGQAPENAMGWSGIFFPLSLGYAVLRSDLLGVDTILRRSVNYALLTALVALGYAGAAAGFDSLMRGHSALTRGAFIVLFAGVSVLLLLPLRDRLQGAVDRIFFRSVYDFRQLVEEASARLAAVTDLAAVQEEIKRSVAKALQPQWITFEVREAASAAAREEPAAGAAGRVEANRLSETHGGALAVPFCLGRRLVALLSLGPRRSGRFYSGDDRRLLQTLANQGAVAIENALALERLRELNRGLESKVEARTAQLERALEELREAQSQLVHQEKMASLGQLVAGIAHEINNPLNYLNGNLQVLREYVDDLDAAVQAQEAALLSLGERAAAAAHRIREERALEELRVDLEPLFRGCHDAVSRATTIVRDLRTFSRLDGGDVTRVDLHEAIASTLTLLASRLADVRVVRDFGELPPVECLGGQINQVLMNLLVNAADAVAAGGTIQVRTRRPARDRVTVEVEDDGRGIAPEHLDRIFDPFFTTKEVGCGTGLGLAISYGVVSRHAGTIQVRSRPGHGTCFRIELPVDFRGGARAGRVDGQGTPGDGR